MKSKIIVPLLAASLLVTGCSATTDSSSKSKTSQQTLSKADKEKIDQGVQEELDYIASIFSDKSYAKNGYFSAKAFKKIKDRLNIMEIALGNKKRLDDNDDSTIKKFSLQVKKQIEKLDYNGKKKFLANLNSPETQYNALYRDDFYSELYLFDRKSYTLNNLDSFLDNITSDDVSEKEAVDEVNDAYKNSLSSLKKWEKEEKSFQQKYADSFDDEGYRMMETVFTNFKDLEENEQSLIEGIDNGKDLDLKKVLNKNDKLVKEQRALFNKLNKKYHSSDDATYADYLLDQDSI